MDPAVRRAVLVALNAHQDLSREAICRLALAVDAWAAGSAASSSPVTGEWVEAMRVSPRALGVAMELAPRAPEIASGLLADAAARGLRVMVAGDDDYPRALRELQLPPPVLYCRGRLPDRPAIAIVGSRAADPYGLEATAFFAHALARAGLTIVSGFARGIDTAAHRAALRDPSGSTVAVLGCGLDVDYPRGSARLRRDIERQGALISEFAIGMPALPENFPVRNRIIAALGCACLVIQAAPRSGSLSTARQALDLGRDVWALPGRIFDRRSTGANQLIRDGASPALDPEHLLDSLPLAVKEELERIATLQAASAAPGSAAIDGGSAQPPTPQGVARRLLETLSVGDPTTVEELARRSGQTIDRVLAALLDLEIEGRVGRVAGSRYVRRAPMARL
jgi:DNA processing protein